MAEAPWKVVHRSIGQRPVIAGRIDGPEPVYFERYLYQTDGVAAPGLPCTVLVTQLGGSRVVEGAGGPTRTEYLPSQSLLVAAGTPTVWQYSGTVDFCCLYFLDEQGGFEERLSILAAARATPQPLPDPLIGMAVQHIAGELQKGAGADQGYMERLVSISLEQALRVLTAPDTHGINPRHVHFRRLQSVLNHIHANLTEDLSADALATIAGVSQAHFRRLFQDAIGLPPHRYVLGARLEQARKLLTMSALPISTIAQECGFSSQSHLTASFRTAHACTPAEYRTRGRR